jgi:hypothetical protein
MDFCELAGPAGQKSFGWRGGSWRIVWGCDVAAGIFSVDSKCVTVESVELLRLVVLVREGALVVGPLLQRRCLFRLPMWLIRQGVAVLLVLAHLRQLCRQEG